MSPLHVEIRTTDTMSEAQWDLWRDMLAANPLPHSPYFRPELTQIAGTVCPGAAVAVLSRDGRDRWELRTVLSDGPVERGLLHLVLGEWDWNRCLCTAGQSDLNAEDIACYVWASVCHGQPLPRIELLLTEEATWNEVMDTASPGDFASTSALGVFFDEARKDAVDQAGGRYGYGSCEDEHEEWLYGHLLNWLTDHEEQNKRIWVRWQEVRVLELIRTMALSPHTAR